MAISFYFCKKQELQPATEVTKDHIYTSTNGGTAVIPIELIPLLSQEQHLHNL